MRAIQQHVPGRLQGSPAVLAWALVTGEALRAPHIIRSPATAQSKAHKCLATLALGNRGEVCSGAVSGLCHCLPRHLLLITQLPGGADEGVLLLLLLLLLLVVLAALRQ